MIKTLIDIMGGGASAPHDMPIPKDNKSITDTILLLILIFGILLVTVICSIDLYKTIKEKNERKKDNENEEEHE